MIVFFIKLSFSFESDYLSSLTEKIDLLDHIEAIVYLLVDTLDQIHRNKIECDRASLYLILLHTFDSSITELSFQSPFTIFLFFYGCKFDYPNNAQKLIQIILLTL